MSQFYGKMWVATAEDLRNVLLKENVYQHLKPENDRMVVHRLFASIFAKYVTLVNNLGEIYDQTLQVQKRKVVENILVAATLRMKELEKELREIELSEFLYLDQTLIEMKLIPQDIQLLKPFYFPLKRKKEVQDVINGVRPAHIPTEEEILKIQEELEKLPKFLRDKITERKEPTPQEIEEKRIRDIFIGAVDLIKKHEKARQKRVLRMNYKTHPEKFYPIPYPGPPEIVYKFQHKPDQRMFKTVKRMVYKNNYYRTDLEKTRTFSLYVCPPKRCPRPDEHQIKCEDLFDKITIPVKKLYIVENQNLDGTKTCDKVLLEQNNAASVIQRAFHKFKMRKMKKKQQIKRKIMLGMTDEYKWDYSIYDNLEDARELRRSKKEEFDRVFIETCQDMKSRILKIRTPWIMEDISDHIRNWFREWYDGVETFDRYPEEFQGGTILVIRGITKTVEEYREVLKKREENKKKTREQRKAEDAEKKAKKEKLKEDKRKAKAALKKKSDDKKRLAAKQGKTWEFNDNEFITKHYQQLNKTWVEYEREWGFINEFQNLSEAPYECWIEIDKYAEVHQELRLIVDEFMRIEYELLRMALSKDLKKKYKPQKPKKNKAKKKKGKKGKKIDLTLPGPLHQLYDNFVSQGIIQKYTKRRLDDFIGEFNYTAYELRNFAEQNPLHFAGEVKQVIRTALLGMGPLKFPRCKSMLLVGPPLCGKKFLMEAICSETDSVLFNLSPNIIKQFNDLQTFLPLITKMAKILQPSILFIDNTHKTFYKKVPKDEREDDPKKLSKVLPKLMKSFQPEDRVMLIGASNDPLKAQLAKLKKTFESIILVPRSDYGTLFLMWRDSVLGKRGVPRYFDVSALSLVTRGFATGQIKNLVDTNVGIRRRMTLTRNPLTVVELLDNLLEGTPYKFPSNEKDGEKLVKFYRKINALAKKKDQKLKLAAEKAKDKKKK